MTWSTYAANLLLNAVYGKQALTIPNTFYVGICTGVTDAGVISGEPSGSGYARVAIVNNDITTFWGTAANKQKVNANLAVQFPTATGAWGTLTVGFLSDVASGAGNVWSYGNLSASITPAAGVPPVIPIGSFVESLV